MDGNIQVLQAESFLLKPTRRYDMEHGVTFLCAFGIDVQRITEPKPAVVRRLFTREEQLELQNAAPDEQGRLFTRFWVKKEAAVKQTGRGLSGLHDPAADSAVFTFAEGDDWVLCVCGEESVHIPVFPVEELLSRVL